MQIKGAGKEWSVCSFEGISREVVFVSVAVVCAITSQQKRLSGGLSPSLCMCLLTRCIKTKSEMTPPETSLAFNTR